MFSTVSICAVLFSLATIHATPDNYILLVTPNCGATNADASNITIRADFDVTAAGLCSGGTTQYFAASENDVVHTLPVYTPAAGSGCNFNKKANSEVYTIVVEISYGEIGSYVHTQQQTYLITCSYDENGLNVGESASRNIIEPYIAPKHIQDNKGAASPATFAISVRDVLNRDITGPIPIGRKVKLHAELSGGNGTELGIKAVACTAVGGGMSFDVLRGGCGDGVIFRQTDGFNTNGLLICSPYFRMFKLSSGNSLQFICNMTVCTSNCDGSSCTNERRKRGIDITQMIALDNGVIEAISPHFQIQSTECDHKPTNQKGRLIIAGQRTMTRKTTVLSYTYMIMLALAALLVMMCCICVGAMFIKKRRHNHLPTDYIPEVIKPAALTKTT